ncbi:MAG: protein kinase [bacterium]
MRPPTTLRSPATIPVGRTRCAPRNVMSAALIRDFLPLWLPSRRWRASSTPAWGNTSSSAGSPPVAWPRCSRRPTTRTGEAVAIKVLPDLRDAGEPLARILQEGRVITGLLHEHIVRVLDHGTADENIGFVVMELLQGESLRDVLDRERTLEPERAVFIIRQVCAGLVAAHARDVFHRDIKPANIMLAEGQRHR